MQKKIKKRQFWGPITPITHATILGKHLKTSYDSSRSQQISLLSQEKKEEVEKTKKERKSSIQFQLEKAITHYYEMIPFIPYYLYKQCMVQRASTTHIGWIVRWDGTWKQTKPKENTKNTKILLQFQEYDF